MRTCFALRNGHSGSVWSKLKVRKGCIFPSALKKRKIFNPSCISVLGTSLVQWKLGGRQIFDISMTVSKF